MTVSSLLLVGAMGIGWHSFDLLVQTIQNSPSLFISDTTATAAAVVSTHTAETSSSTLKHSHGHGHGGVLDPNAAWFALASVIIKEWLYRASKCEMLSNMKRRGSLTKCICHQPLKSVFPKEAKY